MIVETAAEGIWMIDGRGKTSFVNENLAGMLGYTPEDMLGHGPCDFVAEHDRAHAEVSLANLRRGVGGQFEFVLERKDGIELFALVSGNPLYDEDGAFAGGLAMVADITERKLAERRLLAQHAVTQALAESSNILEAIPRLIRVVCEAMGWALGQVWIVDPKDGLLRLRHGWYAAGYKESAFAAASREAAIRPGEGLLGQVWQSGEPAWVVDLAEHGQFFRIDAAAEDGIQSLLTFPILTGTDPVRTVVELASVTKREIDEAALEVLRNVYAQIDQFIKRKQAEERLRVSERRFGALFESAAVGVVVIDPERRIVECNEAYAAIVGYEVSELIGKSLTEITHAEDEALSQDLYDDLLTGERSFTQFEKRFVRKDGGLVWTRISGAPIAEPVPGSEFVVGIAEDITERKQAEESLRESEARFAEAQRIAHIGSWEWDIAEDRVTWSDELLRIYGIERDEFDGTYDAFLERVHPDDRTAVDQIVRTAFESLEPFAFDHRIVRPDGEIRTLQAEGEVVVDSNGTPVRMAGIGHDITRHREAESELTTANERYRSLVEHLPVAVYIDNRDPKSSNIYTSPQIESMLGYSVEEWQSDTDLFVRTLHPEDRARVLAEVERANRIGEPFSSEYRLIARDGRVVWVRDEAVEVAGEDGRSASQGFLLDVTDRKQAEQQLRESEARFRAMFESAAFGLALIDRERHILLTNHSFEEMVGYTKDELSGMSFTELTYAEDEPRSQEIVPKLASGAQADKIEKRYVHKDGSLVWARVTAAPVTDEAGELQFAIGIIEDISERKRAEQRLREGERQYRTLIETARDAFISIDTESVIVDWNQQAEKLFGWSKEEAIGRSMPELIMPPDYRPDHREGLRRFLQTGEERVMDRTLELEALDRGGSRFPIELTIWPTKKGESIRFNSFIRDIRERRELEEQLRHAQKMEAVGRLAGGVAHDFNNLLLAIRGYSELAKAELAALGENGTARESMEQIGKATERAGSLTRQLLAFSRKQVLIPRVVDLNALITSLELLLRGLVGEHVELQLSLARKPSRVRVDPGQLEQVIMNIAINARDAMPEGGRLTIATRRRKLSRRRVRPDITLEPGMHVVLELADTGIGMDELTKSQIFEPFFTTKEGGTGLGLATAYGIIVQSGGQIDVESRPGQGSSFKILLPAAEEPTQEREVERSPRVAETGSETVLVVEDEEALLDLVSTMLERLGYSVLRAGTAREALRLCADYEDDIDLLLTDVVMPDLNGRELAIKFSEHRPGSVVLFMSGYAEPAAESDSPWHGKEADLRKPFGGEELARVVRRSLDLRRTATT